MSNLDAYRLMQRKMVRTPFQQGWQFLIEVEGAPSDFDIYVKDISYGSAQIEYEEKNTGAVYYNYPTRSIHSDVAMTCRDHIDGRIRNWFNEKSVSVVNPDGTINLPLEKAFKWRRYTINESGEKLGEPLEYLVLPVQLGELEETRDPEDGFLQFPMTLISFRS